MKIEPHTGANETVSHTRVLPLGVSLIATGIHGDSITDITDVRVVIRHLESGKSTAEGQRWEKCIHFYLTISDPTGKRFYLVFRGRRRKQVLLCIKKL